LVDLPDKILRFPNQGLWHDKQGLLCQVVITHVLPDTSENVQHAVVTIPQPVRDTFIKFKHFIGRHT
jgi:hypothetical protein